MKWLLLIASFLGQLLAELIPAIGKEIRRNKRVEMKGGHRETRTSVSDFIRNNANRVRGFYPYGRNPP